jgi:methyl-accepting chemotaxis protein
MTDETFRWVVAAAVAIATLSMVVMAAVIVLLFRAVSELQGRVDSFADRAEPVVDSARFLIAENAPKFGDIVSSAQTTAANARDISAIAKDQAQRFSEVGREFAVVGRDFADVGRDIAERAKTRVARIDAAVDDTVEQAQQLGDNVKSAIVKPIHEFSGVLAGIRAGVSAYAQGQRPSVARATQDEEMFI